MTPKAAHEAAKKKAKKQKRLLMVLAVPMIAALAYSYTTLTSLGGKSGVSATPAAATTPASSIPTAGTTTTPVTPGIVATSIDALRTFTALGRKDPFHDHGPNLGAPTAPNSKDSKKGGGSKSSAPAGPLTGAVISINGTKLALALGTEFGHAPGLTGVQLFRLLRVTRTSALIGVVGTKQQFTLHVRHALTLQQTGGWTYTLILEPPGAAAPMTVQPATGK